MPRKKSTTPPQTPPIVIPAGVISTSKKETPTGSERTGLKLVLRKDKNESSWTVAPTIATTTTTSITSPTVSTKSKDKEKHKHKHKHHKHKDKEKEKDKQKAKDDDKIPPIRIPKITIKTSDMVINRELTTPLVTAKSAPALSLSTKEKEHKTRRNSLEEAVKPSVVEKKRRKSDTSDSSSSRSDATNKKLRIESEETGAKGSSLKEARKKKESPKKTIESKPKESSEDIARRVASIKKIGTHILAKLIKQDKYGIFYEPVSEKDVPDYYQVIKNPMDFSTLRTNLNSGDYDTLEAFEADLLRIFQNAMIYNRPGTIYFDQAKAFQSAASGLLDASRSRVETQPIAAVSKAPSTPTSTTVVSKPILPPTPTPPTSAAIPTTPSPLKKDKKKKKKKQKDGDGISKSPAQMDKKKSKDKKDRRKSDEKPSKKRKSLDIGDLSKSAPNTPQTAVPPPPLPPPPISQSPHVELPGGFSDLVDGQPLVKKRGRPLGSKNKGPRRRPGEESADGESKRRKVRRDSTTDQTVQSVGTPVDSAASVSISSETKTLDTQSISSPIQSKPLASAAKASTPTPSSYPPKTTTPTSQPPTATARPVVSSSPAKGTPTPSKPRKVYVPSSAVTPTATKPTKPATPSTPNSPSYNMYISKRATNGTSGSMLHSPISSSQTNNYINTAKPKIPPTPISSFSTERAYRASLEAFVKSLGKNALDQVAKFISTIRTSPVVIQSQTPPTPPPQPKSQPQSNRITLSPDILGDLKSITDDSIDIDALQEILSLRNDGLEIVDTIAAKILEEDTYRFLRKMQEEYAVNSEESVELDENASKVQEVLDSNFELLCALQMQQYQRLNSSPNDTEVKLVSQLSENLKQLTRQVEPGILIDLQTIQAKLNTFRKRMSFSPNAEVKKPTVAAAPVSNKSATVVTSEPPTIVMTEATDNGSSESSKSTNKRTSDNDKMEIDGPSDSGNDVTANTSGVSNGPPSTTTSAPLSAPTTTVASQNGIAT